MTNKDITKIYFQGNEIVALYKGDTLIFKKSSGGGSTPKPTGVYKIKGMVTKSSGCTQFNIPYNNKQSVNVKVNKDLTFETDLQEPLTNASGMFRGMSYLETLDLNNLDTSKVTVMYDMFSQSTYLKDIKLNIDTSKVYDMQRVFNGCTRLETLDLSNFDTSNATTFYYMFRDCSSLKTLDLSNFDTSKVTDIRSMFQDCSSLKTLDLSSFDTAKVTMGFDVFRGCKALETIMIGNLDLSHIWDINYFFGSCVSLKNVIGKFKSNRNDLDLSDSPLTAQSAMVFINGLATVTEKRTLSLSATTYDSLTAEQIAIATNKGWTVIRG